MLSRGRFGYVAKYRWVAAEDVVLILAVRHQLEAGYKEDRVRKCRGAIAARRLVALQQSKPTGASVPK
jgi:hypothetical protein